MNKLKILVIPSWYPNEKDKLWGNYFIKQSEALNEYADVSMLYINRIGLKELKKYKKEKLTDGYDKNLYKFNFYKKTIINYKAVSIDYSFKRYEKAAYKAYKKYIEIIGKPDIILVESTLPAGLAAKYIKEKENIPYVVHEHSLDVLNNPIYKKYVNEILKNADDYMAVNSDIANSIKKVRKDCHIVPNFIDCNKFDVERIKTNKDFNLISICNFYKVKALEVLLKALNIVVNEKNNKDVKLKIVGTGDYKDYYQSVCNSLNLNENVEFVGYVENAKIPNILANSDVLCISSTVETFCIPIVEAFSSGIPVITTDCTGPLEIVDKTNSIVVPKNNIEEYSDAIIKMKKDYKKYNSKEIKKYAFDRYDKSVICKKIINIFENIIK